MKNYMILLFGIIIAGQVFSYDTFFCIDGPLRIRNAPSLTSTQIGSLNLFDTAEIIERTENMVTIDNISDYWFKIKFNEIEGFIFGGYGIILKEKYEINTIDDFTKIIPDKTSIRFSRRYLFTSKIAGDIPMVRLDYLLKFSVYYFNLTIYIRPKQIVDINKFSEDFNLEIDPASNYFGMGGSYGLLKDYEKSDEIITHYGDRGRYFFSDWASGTSRDIGTFLFEMDFAQIFDGIIIEGLNMWTNYTDKNIFKINNQYIMDARKERIRESIIYQILYETILRIEIEK